MLEDAIFIQLAQAHILLSG